MIEAVHLKKDNRSYISTGNDACVLSEITHIDVSPKQTMSTYSNLRIILNML